MDSKTGSNYGSEHRPTTRPDPAEIVDPMTRDPMTRFQPSCIMYTRHTHAHAGGVSGRDPCELPTAPNEILPFWNGNINISPTASVDDCFRASDELSRWRAMPKGVRASLDYIIPTITRLICAPYRKYACYTGWSRKNAHILALHIFCASRHAIKHYIHHIPVSYTHLTLPTNREV